MSGVSFRHRIGASVGLSLFFLIVYGGSQRLAGAVHSTIPSFHFDWEKRVPFFAWMMIPYLSIDLFFVAAPLLATSMRELRTYCLRILASISFAAVVFVVMPLKFAFERPVSTSWIGRLCGWFHQLDAPTNELPSLHIATLVIVGGIILRHTSGMLRTLVIAWFALIAISPLFVHQHHIVDLFAGLALGLGCVALIQDEPREPFEMNRRVTVYYVLAAIMLSAISISIGSWSWPLWWPAVSLAMVAIAYCFAGTAIYQKKDGRLSVASQLLFAPSLAGQWVSLRWYARKGPAHQPLTENLWIGRRMSQCEARLARSEGVEAVIDLTSEFSEPAAFRDARILYLSTLDLTAPTQQQLEIAVRFIETQIEAHPRAIVYVHCKAGYSRTAAVAAAYLLASGRARQANEAIAQVRAARPATIIRPETRRAIEIFERRLAIPLGN